MFYSELFSLFLPPCKALNNRLRNISVSFGQWKCSRPFWSTGEIGEPSSKSVPPLSTSMMAFSEFFLKKLNNCAVQLEPHRSVPSIYVLCQDMLCSFIVVGCRTTKIHLLCGGIIPLLSLLETTVARRANSLELR